MAKWKGFVGPSYTAKSKIAAYDRSVNVFCERVESGTGPAAYTLYQTPGFANFVTLSDSPGRGGLSIGGTGSSGSISGNTYLVAGSTLFLYPSTTLATGIVNGSDGVVEMVTNGDRGHQLLFQSDSTAYCFDTTSQVLTSVGIGHSVAFLKGYGLRLDQFDNQFYFSAPFDFSTWDPLDVVPREDAADNWVRLIVYHNEVWLLGARTTSIYYVADDDDIPFQPITSAFMNMGIFAPASACIVGGSLMWIGQDAGGKAVVYRANGYNPERISTHAVEYAFQSALARLIDAEGTYYQQNGHDFYEITIPSQTIDGVLVENGAIGSTWVYDATEGLWHERGEWIGLQYKEMDTRGYFGGPEISLSRTSGKTYVVLPTYYTGTDGLGIRWLRRAPHLTDENKGVIIDRVELKFQPGVANATGSGSDPQVALRWSNNGGQTWSNTHTRSMGLLGEYDVRAEWLNLGFGRDRLIEVTGSNPIFTPIIDAFVDARTGGS